MTESNKVPSFTYEDAIANGVKGKSGKTYFFNSELSTDRYFKAMEWLVELAHGMPVSEHLKKIDEAIIAGNEGKWFDVCVALQKMRDNQVQLITRNAPAIKLFCLYFSTEDENQMEFNESKIDLKVKDLNHYSYHSFFGLVLSLLNFGESRLKQIAEQVTQDILQSPISMGLTEIREKSARAMLDLSKSSEKEKQVKSSPVDS